MKQIGKITTIVDIKTGKTTIQAFYYNELVASCVIDKNTDPFATVKRLLWKNKSRSRDFKRLIAQYECELCYRTDNCDPKDVDNFIF